MLPLGERVHFLAEFFRCAGVAGIYNRDSSESVKKEKEMVTEAAW